MLPLTRQLFRERKMFPERRIEYNPTKSNQMKKPNSSRYGLQPLSLLVILIAGLAFMNESIRHELLDTQNPKIKKKEDRLSGSGKQMSMWWWGRAYPEPDNINDKYMAAWDHAVKMKEYNTAERFGNPGAKLTLGAWNSIGPKTLGGRMLSLAINPVRHKTLFAGSASGGIWKSYTGGVGLNAWQPVETGLPVLGVPSIAYHPSDSNIIYAGTGEVYRVDSTSGTPNPGNTGYNVWKTRGTYGVGLLRSTDAGQTWTQVFTRSMSQLFGIQKILIHPTNSNWVMIAATDGLYRYDNSTGTTTKLYSITYVSDVYVNPSDPTQVVIAVGNLGNTLKGIYRSTNSGTSFTKITAGLPASFQGYISFDVHASSNTLYASIGVSSSSTTELYRSTDQGVNWSAITNTGHGQWQYWFAHACAVDPNNVNRVFVLGAQTKKRMSISGTAGTASTIAGGSASMNSYIALGGQEGGSSYLHDDIHDLEYVPGRSDSLYFLTDGGIFLTLNANNASAAGITFQSCNSGLTTAQFFGPVGQSSTDANFFLGGLQDNNTAVYNGATGLWKRSIGGDGGPAQVKPDNDNIVLASRDARQVYRSSNKMSTTPGSVTNYWGSVADSRTGFMAPLAWSPSNTNVVYLASDNLHKSTDAGATFSNNAYGTAANYIEAYRKPAIAMAVAPNNENVVYVSTSPFAQYDNDVDNVYYNAPANFMKTTTGNTPFSSVYGTGLPTPNRYILDIAVHPTNSNIVWVSLGGYGTGHIFRSTDGGATWEDRSGSGITGLPDVPTGAVLIDPDNTNIIYAGNDLGVYISTNAGATWYDFNDGLWDATQIMDLVFAPGNLLRAATHGKGVFETIKYSGVLPVVVNEFTGVTRNTFNELTWKVSLENGLSRYELERSSDGINFRTINTVTPMGGTGDITYTKQDPLGGVQDFTYYYRLKMVNIDGTYEYSSVVLLRKNMKEEVAVAGNPFASSFVFRYNFPEKRSLELNLFDVQGKRVHREQFTTMAGSGNITIGQLDRLSSGTYLLVVTDNRKKWEFKLVKN